MARRKNEDLPAPAEIDETAADDIVGGGFYSTTSSLKTLSSHWLSVNGIDDRQIDSYSEPVETEDQPTLPSISGE